MKILTELKRLAQQLYRQGLLLTLWAGVDKAGRLLTGGPLVRFSRITEQIWLGGQPTPRGWRRLFSIGLTGVINMRSEYNYEQLVDFGSVRYLHLPTIDNEAPTLEHLSEGVDFIRQELDQAGKVYIHCWEGLGRGPTMAAAYFVSQGLSPTAAWARIRAVRPFVRPTAGQLQRLETFAQEYQPHQAIEELPEISKKQSPPT